MSRRYPFLTKKTIFCVVDIFLFNVSYVFELFIAVIAFVAALDFHRALSAATSLDALNGEV